MVMPPTSEAPEALRYLTFDDNGLLTALYGDHDRHLARIEQQLDVSVTSRGNQVAVSGPEWSADTAVGVLNQLYGRLKSGLSVGLADVDAALRIASVPADEDTPDESMIELKTPKRRITPRSRNQARYLQTLADSEMVFALGPAGTGKTYLAVAMAVAMMEAGQVDRIVLSRPAVEAGERLGFLPGDLREKVDPYLRPLYDALYDMLPTEKVNRRLASDDIEIAPLAFMRGRTLSNAFVILDEAQNTTAVQMKMFLTRLGENARMVVTGDLSQVDLPPGQTSGLADALGILDGVDGIGTVRFTDVDVVRHELVARIVRAYDRRAGNPGKT
ncbi:MAG: PhoH family protein [Alphaproteobacteria bacterium]|jgi:phosphate starvation-inducible protein PhoH and related proteins|nr:PhoH family protein [Alphaproteobacteria bacterium]